MNKYLQGRVEVPTGGIAREQFLQIRCNSEADSIVWMKEGKKRFNEYDLCYIYL